MIIDITGHKYGHLTALKMVEGRNSSRSTMWECRCDCGNLHICSSNSMRTGSVGSCGCMQIKNVKEALTKHGHSVESGIKIKIYRVWRGMRNRCNSPTNESFVYYGERGISICDEWADYSVFYEWAMSNGYQIGLSIERIDVNGNYEPGNCKWATTLEQSRNRRSNNYITIDGVTKIITDWASSSGVPVKTIYERQKRGVVGQELLIKYKPKSHE